jgi:hypothetical protein
MLLDSDMIDSGEADGSESSRQDEKPPAILAQRIQLARWVFKTAAVHSSNSGCQKVAKGCFSK